MLLKMFAGTYSSGDCSGFTPDSLLRFMESINHQSAAKVGICINLHNEGIQFGKLWDTYGSLMRIL